MKLLRRILNLICVCEARQSYVEKYYSLVWKLERPSEAHQKFRTLNFYCGCWSLKLKIVVLLWTKNVYLAVTTTKIKKWISLWVSSINDKIQYNTILSIISLFSTSFVSYVLRFSSRHNLTLHPLLCITYNIRCWEVRT